MSRKDFRLIANTILHLNLEGVQRHYIACKFADQLEEKRTQQFNRVLFIQAATGVVPVNARKPRGA